MSYQGHLPDGSSVQRHSAGGLYPYVVYAREVACATVWGVMTPDGREGLVGSYDDAVHKAEEMKAQYDAQRMH